MAIYARRRLHPLYLKRVLGRALTGVDDGDKSTGEYGILHALNAGDVDRVRSTLGSKRDPLVREDFAERIVAHIATDERQAFFSYSIDVPARVWHEAARTGRLEGRSFRRVLGDYLTRGWEVHSDQRKEADTPREALREELQRFRVVIADAHSKTPAATGALPSELEGLAVELHALEERVKRLVDLDRAQTNALVAIVAALNERKWIPKAMVGQLQREGWLA
jgi:hypothetical protein